MTRVDREIPPSWMPAALMLVILLGAFVVGYLGRWLWIALLLLSCVWLVGCGAVTRAPASVPVHYWVPQYLEDTDRLCVPAPSGGYCKRVRDVRAFIAAQETE